MKRIFMLLAICVMILPACSEQFDSRRKIYVSGYAETEITPDIIYFSISLKEYFKGSGNKVNMEILEKQLYGAVLKAGIPKQNFTINDVSSYNMASQKQKNPDFAVRKQYRVKMGDLNKIGHTPFRRTLKVIDNGISSVNPTMDKREISPPKVSHPGILLENISG